jgi:hypothetical protein
MSLAVSEENETGGGRCPCFSSMWNHASCDMSVRDICPSDRILLHIGFHKTATTWFQSELFSRSELDFKLLSARNLVHQAFCISNPFPCDRDKGVRQIVTEAHEATALGRYFVVSHERLSGYPASGGFDSRMLADRLKLHFPNARLFCLFREQRAMILSAWRQQVVDGGGLSLSHFIDPPEPEVRRMPLFDPMMYQYSHLLEHYRGLFGAGNVLFRPYEQFCAEPARILADLAHLLENEKLRRCAEGLATNMKTPNPSLSMPVLHMQRILNVLFARTQLSQGYLINIGTGPIRAVIRIIDRAIGRNMLRPMNSYSQRKALQKISGRLGVFFDDDNARLSRLIGMRLSDLGYSVNEQAV